MQKSIIAVIMAATLTACGGSSSGQTSGFSQALKLCGQESAYPIYEGAVVSEDDQRYKLAPQEPEATIEIQDSGSIVCITGGLYGVGFSGSNHAAYVNGSVTEVLIPGGGNTLVVWGTIAGMEITGDNNRVFARGVGTYDDHGEGNTVQDVALFNFPQ